MKKINFLDRSYKGFLNILAKLGCITKLKFRHDKANFVEANRLYKDKLIYSCVDHERLSLY